MRKNSRKAIMGVSGNSPSLIKRKLTSEKRFVKRNNSMPRKVSKRHEEGILKTVLGKII